jgi:MFS family permease
LIKTLNRPAVTSLVLSRAVYAINWYNAAAVFAFVAYDFGQNVSGLGLATASFFIGVGLFQIPSGILAAKFGPRYTAVYGMLLSSLAALLTAFSSSFDQFVILRFLVGAGMALFFGPGVTLVSNYFHRDSRGVGLGIFNAAFYVGGSLGLFVWSVLAELTGWRMSLGISGALGIMGALLLFTYVPKEKWNGFKIQMTGLKRILTDRWLLVLSLELLGFNAGTALITNFMVYYLEGTLNLTPAVAGGVGSLTPLTAIFASPLFGQLYDKTRRPHALLFLSGVLLTIAVGVASLGSIYSAVASTIIAGFCGGAFTVAYLAARESRAVTDEYQTLAVSWVNNIQMIAGFWSPLTFSTLVVLVGYADSWLIAATYTLALTSIILFARRPRGN